MKKFLSFALALAMTASLVPATAFAATDARVNKVITAENDDDLYNGTGDTKESNFLILKADGDFKNNTQEFEVKLENAEWYENAAGTTMIDGYVGNVGQGSGNVGQAGDAPAELQTALTNAQSAVIVAQAKVDSLKSTSESGLIAAQAALDTANENLNGAGNKDNATKGDVNYKGAVKLASEAAAALATAQTDLNNLKAQEVALQTIYDNAVAALATAEYTDATAIYGTVATPKVAPTAKDGTALSMADKSDFKTLDDGTNYVYYTITAGAGVLAKGTAIDPALHTFDAVGYATDKATRDAYVDAKAKVTSIEGAVTTASANLDVKKAAVAAIDLTALTNADTAAKTELATCQADYTAKKAVVDAIAPSAEYTKAAADLKAAKADVTRINAEIASYTPANGTKTFEVTKKSASTIIVRVTGTATLIKDDEVQIPLWTNLTGGNATVTVDAKNSEFSSETKTFAKTVDGATVFTTEGVKNFYDGEALKDFFVEEVTPGTFEKDKKVTVRVSGGFEFEKNKGTITVIAGDLAARNTEISYENDGDEIFFTMPNESTTISQIKFAGFELDEDGADYGDDAELTISGAGIDRTTIKVGTYADFGITMEAEDKELPVIYAGTKADSDNDNTTLKVVIEETVAGSFIANRKVELKLPEGVEFSNVNEGIDDSGSSFKVSNFKDNKGTVQAKFDCNSDGDKITINGMPAASGDSKKRKVEVVFDISAAADFTGDVDLTLTGPGVANEELTTTIATVKAPIEVKADVNELKLDYRNTEASDITLVEPAAGVWDKNDKIILEVEEMQFESGIKAEVVSGDIKLKKLDGDYVDVNKKDGTITIEVDSKSGKTPAEIKISGVKLYMDRNLPAGDYKLNVYGDKNNETFINNYDAKGDDDMPNFFDTDSITAMDDYIKVVTAGRDQDDATFTTKITVPVGADKIMAGTKEIALDAPAYINKDGYTMLPVRAVTEALNGVAAIKWDDATKTATINFGQRVFSMKVNSKVMNINGVQTNVLAAPEIKNDRIFLPLRDLGYALGLTDSKIAWDSATSTATLN